MSDDFGEVSERPALKVYLDAFYIDKYESYSQRENPK